MKKSEAHVYERSMTMNSAQSATNGGQKCYPIFLGGSTMEPGLTTSSMDAHACDRLRCAKCDKSVIRFGDDVKWAEHVDYIFVRNYNTYIEKLREGTEPAEGYACYACQCQWTSVNQ